MINLNKDSIIYLLCHSKNFTGGPLALHQLGFKLNNMGFKVMMFYVPEVENPVNENFSKYNLPYTFRIKDAPNNILIVPETATRHLFNYKMINKAIWWLSIDNFFKSTFKNKLGRLLGVIRKFNFKDAHKYYHFVQSKYAYEYLKAKANIDDERLYMLSDYLLDDFFQTEQFDITLKEDLVLYNPKKGYDFTQKIIKKSKNEFRWLPLENMSPAEVKKILLKSKVYIDFGNHPGKDRFPREAVICGCCIITGKKGSAGFFEDIPIGNEFKFNNTDAEIDRIIEKIRIILKDYISEQKKFHDYVHCIKTQEAIFEKEIRDIFAN
jgi:hypothetical protein